MFYSVAYINGCQSINSKSTCVSSTLIILFPRNRINLFMYILCNRNNDTMYKYY